eukprot:TRINITY_DN7874_c0_g1_i1.p1 TRINITY_DN7874_c0_g1~~TRINITY_DN7874_c0_g1_i1.p1  ORF type:complete len:411 (-),score=52.66 TRINITY_DN7874_c0_g1_i1:184-1416(-)
MTMSFLNYYDERIPACPSNFPNNVAFSSLLLLSLTAFLSFGFSLAIFFFFNQIPVGGQWISNPSVSNYKWSVYFLFISLLRSTSQCLHYALSRFPTLSHTDRTDRNVHNIFSIFELTITGLTVLALSCALSHQLKYRNTDKSSNHSQYNLTASNSRRSPRNLFRYLMLGKIEGLFFLLFILYLSSVILLFTLSQGSSKNSQSIKNFFDTNLVMDSLKFANETNSSSSSYSYSSDVRNSIVQYIFFACWIIQHIPIFLLVVAILFNFRIRSVPVLAIPNRSYYNSTEYSIDGRIPEGEASTPEARQSREVVSVSIDRQRSGDRPKWISKIILVVGTLMVVGHDVPLSVWGHYLPGGCLLRIGSLVDVVGIVYMVGLMLYFVFVRAEFLRIKEESIWNTHSIIQDVYDGRGI